MTGQLALAAIAGCTLAPASGAGDAPPAGWQPFGRSVEGRELVVFGTRSAGRGVLVVGCIHGTECAGVAIARRLATQGCPPCHADVWTVPDLNPDGHRRGTRGNARGVDLNRNFAGGWQPIGARGDPQYAGPRSFSEPESRAARRLVRRIRPAVTVWYHQGQGPLVRAWGPSVPSARLYAKRARLPFRRMPWLAGTAPHWQNVAFPGTSSFVVELPDGRLTRIQAGRHARAVAALARDRDRNAREVRGSLQGGR
jgi:murein peptide amidase A